MEENILDNSRILGSLSKLLQGAVIVPDAYEMSLYALCFQAGASGAFLAIDGKTQYFDCVVGSYNAKRHSINSGVHVWSYEPLPEPGVMVKSCGIWLYQTYASGWLYGIDCETKPQQAFLEGLSAVTNGAIGFVRESEKRVVGKDKLTGLWDRGTFYKELQHMCAITNKNKTPLFIIFIDLNNFKTVNDVLGHPVGDRVLISQASKIQRAVSSIGISARYGGDEFSAIISGHGREHVNEIARRIESQSFESPGGIKVSASVGISEYIIGESPESFVERADQHMFEAKRLFKERMKQEGIVVSR